VSSVRSYGTQLPHRCEGRDHLAWLKRVRALEVDRDGRARPQIAVRAGKSVHAVVRPTDTAARRADVWGERELQATPHAQTHTQPDTHTHTHTLQKRTLTLHSYTHCTWNESEFCELMLNLKFSGVFTSLIVYAKL
jgi:hypothetical protein